MSEVKGFLGETFDDHFPIYCELGFPNSVFTESVNEIAEIKCNVVW